ncbi:tyrosine-type recombinase/integrase [Pseudoalteromonas sp. DY56-GL79]|uniref:tyrosine-type recombinase/integrase n=1 Tax=Pseudoalteromonas sp. DY56-GL79 TaxID=2967131 RepID=UPI00352A2F09
MVQLINSSNVFRNTKLNFDEGYYHCIPIDHNIGSLPTFFSRSGQFLIEPNSYLFYLKTVKKAKDLSPCSRALLKYYQFLEEEKLDWDHFPPIKRLKPTYLFRSYLLSAVKSGELAHSTANAYINQVKSFYLWTIHERYLVVNSEQEAPFKIEFVQVQNQSMLAHLRPKFTVETSDLRIKVPKQSGSQNIRPLSPLSQSSIETLTLFLFKTPVELKLQVLLSLDTGMRIEEVASFSLGALKTAYPVAESCHRFEVTLCPQSNGVKTKLGKRRTVEISIELLKALQEYQISERRLRRANKLYRKLKQISDMEISGTHQFIDSLKHCERHEPLFISQQGNPVTRETISSRWLELRASMQRHDTSFTHKFHDLRATYGTYRLNDLLEAGLGTTESLELLMSWMGHNSENTTWKYLKFLKRRDVFKAKFGILDTIMHEALGNDDEL